MENRTEWKFKELVWEHLIKSQFTTVRYMPGWNKTSWNLCWVAVCVASLFLMSNYMFLEISLIEVAERCALRWSRCHFCLILRSTNLLFLQNVYIAMLNFMQTCSQWVNVNSKPFSCSGSSSFDVRRTVGRCRNKKCLITYNYFGKINHFQSFTH